MSLYQKSSLVQIPSGYKASSANLYSVVPNNGDGDFTVSVAAGATRVNKDGLIESVSANQARLNYDPTNPQDPYLLLEPTRRNLFLNSENFTNSSWIKTRTTITGNETTAPDGTNSADLLTGDGTGTSYVYDGVFLYTANYYISIFVKNINGNDFTIQNFTQSGSAVFDLTDGTLTSTSGTISDAKIEQYPNDWYRVSAKITSTLGGANCNLGFGVKNYNGDQFYIWGAQIEDNSSGGSASYASSYIPTTTQKTRTIDYASGAGNSALFNDSEGTLFLEAAALGDDGTIRVINISDGSTSNRVLIQLGGTNNLIRADLVSSGATQTSLTTTSYTFTEYNKIALKYKGDDTALFVNGTQIGSTQTGKTMPTGLDRIDFTNGNLGSSFYFTGKLKQLMYFDTALSDSELQTLTS